MKNILSVIFGSVVVGTMISMLAVATINLDESETLALESELLDQTKQTVKLESELLDQTKQTVKLEQEGKAQTIMLLQAKRVAHLEGKLTEASNIINNKVNAIEMREKLLVSTAEKLQDAINELAKAKTELDRRGREVYSLKKSLKRVSTELAKVKRSLLKLNVPTPAPRKSLLDPWNNFK